MDDITKYISTIPSLATIFFLWKAGIITFKGGNGTESPKNEDTGHQAQIDKLDEHAKVANHEMGEVKDRLTNVERDISDIKSDVSFIRGQMSRK